MDGFLILLAVVVVGLVAVAGMLPMQAVRTQLGALLAADVTTLAPVAANQAALIIAPFSPSEQLTVSSLTLGSTNGLAPKACATGSAEVAIDPTSQAQLITLVPGSGSGFRWVTSGSWTAPITVYGVALIDSTGAVLLAVEQFAQPITVSASGYQIDADPLQMVFVLQPLS
jgi:hypothetical protein